MMINLDLALLLLHLYVGLFFTFSGFRKCFVPGTQKLVWGVFRKYNVPKWQGYAVVYGQLFGGLGVLFGALTNLAALGLIPIIVGAIKLSLWPEFKAQYEGSSWTRMFPQFLCKGEPQLLLGLVLLVLMGGGEYSVDAFVRSWGLF